jgi:hypothetical protein
MEAFVTSDTWYIQTPEDAFSYSMPEDLDSHHFSYPM